MWDAQLMEDGVEAWERHAAWWQKGFTGGVDAEYEEQILPLAEELLKGRLRVVDIGAGEGQVARRLTDCVGEVVGREPTVAQLAEAQRRGGRPIWTQGRAEGLPFAEDSFDGAVGCLVFEHILEFDVAISEPAQACAQ